RFIGDCFDVYFHLWNNGSAYRPRDEIKYMEECDAEWIPVISKRVIRSGNGVPSAKKVKYVRFAENLVQASPPIKHKPRELTEQSVKIGSMIIKLPGVSS